MSRSWRKNLVDNLIRGWYAGEVKKRRRKSRYFVNKSFDNDETPILPRHIGKKWPAGIYKIQNYVSKYDFEFCLKSVQIDDFHSRYMRAKSK